MLRLQWGGRRPGRRQWSARLYSKAKEETDHYLVIKWQFCCLATVNSPCTHTQYSQVSECMAMQSFARPRLLSTSRLH